MAWLPIDPRYLRQATAGRTLAYVSRRAHDDGSLVLHLDQRGAVEHFELTYSPLVGGRDLVAVWDRVAGLRLGQTDGDREAQRGPRPHASPLVRRHRQPAADDIARLLAYVERNAAPVDARHRATVLEALQNGAPDAGVH